jgi:hypothetical protein
MCLLFRRGACDFTVGRGRRGNDDSIDVVAFQRLAVIRERFGSVAIASLPGPVQISIADGDQFGAGVFPNPGHVANPSCASTADDSEAHLGLRATRSLSGSH